MDGKKAEARALATSSPTALQPGSGFGPLVRSSGGTEDAIFTLHGNWETLTTWAAIMAAVGLTAVAALAEALWILPVNFLAAYAVQSGLGAWRLRRRFATTPRVERLADVTPGALVRLVGTLEPEDPRDVFLAASGRPALHARTLFFDSTPAGLPLTTAREDVRGVPARIRLQDGTTVRLLPATLRLMDRPKQLRNAVREALRVRGAARYASFITDRPARFEEASLGPGDEIEAVGHVTAEAHARGEGVPVRGVPLLHTLAPLPGGWIWVRTRRRG